MSGPVIHIVKNFPLQYIYYNQIVGGVDKAYRKYETDYYLVSLKPGTEWIKKNILPGQKNNTIIISNAPSATIGYYFRNFSDTVSLPYTRYYDRGLYNWDYAVFFMNYIDPYQIRTGIWPPKNTVHEVTVDGVPVCAVVKRENRDDYRGVKLMNEAIKAGNAGMMIQGTDLLEKAIEYDKYNEVAYLTLAHGYIMLGQFNLARQKLNELLTIYPEYDKALNMMGYCFLSESSVKKDLTLVDRSIAILNQALEVNYKNTQTYYYLGLAFMIKGNDEEALQYFNKAIELNPRYREPYYSIAQMLEKRGNLQEAARYRKYADSL